jgi:hypothetical protein
VLLEMKPGRRKFEVRTKEIINIVTRILIYGCGHERETLLKIKYDNE